MVIVVLWNHTIVLALSSLSPSPALLSPPSPSLPSYFISLTSLFYLHPPSSSWACITLNPLPLLPPFHGNLQIVAQVMRKQHREKKQLNLVKRNSLLKATDGDVSQHTA